MRLKQIEKNEGVMHLTSVMKEASLNTYLPGSHQNAAQQKETPLLYPNASSIVGGSSNTETSGSIGNLSIDDEDHENGMSMLIDPSNTQHLIREKWSRRCEFILMLFGYTVGLGNVWRFPYLCHKNGGASFLIPYFIFLMVEGMPLYYMELCIGQRFRQGSIGVWHTISPYLDGLSLASALVCIMVCLYYNVILSWCLIYLVNSFKDPLPWSHCPNKTIRTGNETIYVTNDECLKSGPTSYFWYRSTLDISDSIEDGNSINWTIAFSLLITWFVVWLCMIKRIKSEGKVVYVTATLPLVLLAVMFFRGVHLDGFQQGLALLFIPNFSSLKDPLVWLDAASQTFYSLGIAYGSLIAFASYNPLKNDTTRDAIMLCLIDAGVSIYASIVMFCFIGYRAQQRMNGCLEKIGFSNFSEYSTSLQFSVDGTTHDGGENKTVICDKQFFLGELSQSTGLAFITFTEAINSLPHSQMWSVLFFLMLLMLGVDTQFGMLEGLFTPLFDSKLLRNVRTEIVSGIICLAIFLMSLIMTQHSGNYWLQVIENYSVGIPLLVIALVECLAVSYVYGIKRLSVDIEYMTNKKPHKIWVLCWTVISPLLIIAVLVFSVRDLCTKTPTYQVWNAGLAMAKYVSLPTWVIFVAVCLMFTSIMLIPIVALLRYYKIIFSRNTRKRHLDTYKTFEMDNVHRPVQKLDSTSTRITLQSGGGSIRNYGKPVML